MSHIYTSADQLTGGTPLLELTHVEQDYHLEARVLAKLEYFNPAGSVKDRVAKAMLDDAEARGVLKPTSVMTFQKLPLLSLSRCSSNRLQ